MRVVQRQSSTSILQSLALSVVILFAGACTKTQFDDNGQGPSLAGTGGNFNGGGFQGKAVFYHFDNAACSKAGILDPAETVSHSGKLVVEPSQAYYDESACDGRSGRVLTSQEQSSLVVQKNQVTFENSYFTTEPVPGPINTSGPTRPATPPVEKSYDVSCIETVEHAPGTKYVFNLVKDVGTLINRIERDTEVLDKTLAQTRIKVQTKFGASGEPVSYELIDAAGDLGMTIDQKTRQGRLTSKKGLIAGSAVMTCAGTIFKY